MSIKKYIQQFNSKLKKVVMSIHINFPVHSNQCITFQLIITLIIYLLHQFQCFGKKKVTFVILNKIENIEGSSRIDKLDLGSSRVNLD